MTLDENLEACPIIAILRGLHPDQADDVGDALYAAGIRVAEVPLNSPDPFASIARLAQRFSGRMSIGAGTVTRAADVERLRDAGGAICVSPNMNVDVIAGALSCGMEPIPGIATATEAFAAVEAGAKRLKMFPAGGHAADIAALRSVLPADIQIVAVGGVGACSIASFRTVGCSAFGIGSELFRPDYGVTEIARRARSLVAACRPRPIEMVAQLGAMIGETPQRIGDEVLVVDPVAPALFRVDANGAGVRRVALSRPVWGIEPAGDGTLIATVDDALARLDPDSGVLTPGGTVRLAPGERLNDLTVGADGAVWAGSMHRGVLAGRGALFRATDWQAPLERVASGLGVANGLAVSADGATLYVIDTLARTLMACRIAGDSLAEPRIVTDFMGIAGKPDGMAIAQDGSLWVAMWGGGAIVRIAPDGAMLDSISVPAPHVSSVCSDGPDHLWVSTSRARLSEAALDAAPWSGALYRIAL